MRWCSSSCSRCCRSGGSRQIRLSRLAAALVAAILASSAAGSAHAAAKSYWSYWQVKGDAWTYAATGPADSHPKDGQVEGWRYTAGSEGKAAKPRTTPDFDTICRGVRIKDGYKRVGIVVDHGTKSDAPEGAKPPKTEPETMCVVAENDATGEQVLNKAVHTEKAGNGLLCSLDGYPSNACGGSTSTKAASPSASDGQATGDDSSGSNSTLIAVVIAAIVAVALVAAMATRRRRENR